MEYPVNIQIETSAFCNARCGFCTYSSRSLEPSVRMSRELFGKIIEEISSWPTHPNSICPFLTNEPFADARIFEFCRLINHSLPNTKLIFYTNGSLFSDRAIKDLSYIRNIQFINISLHHTNARDYEAELGIPYAKTLESIDRLIAAHRAKPIAEELILLKVGNSDPVEDHAFVVFCAKRFPGIKPMPVPRWNWRGEIASKMSYEPYLDIVCPRAYSMCILATGKVALCCLDQNAKYCQGDVNELSLLEIYNGPYRAHRLEKKRNFASCETCNMHG